MMIQRVNGSLAVSRALGDFEYKNVDGKGPTEQLGEKSNCRLRRKRIGRREKLALALDKYRACIFQVTIDEGYLLLTSTTFVCFG